MRRVAAGLQSHDGMLMLLLLVLLVVALFGGGLGYSRWGAAGWSPAGILILVLVLLLIFGYRF